jgi:hypothetical protein
LPPFTWRRPPSAAPGTANYARQGYREGTSTANSVLKFAVNEISHFVFDAVSYGRGNITVDIDWVASATSGKVQWEASIAALTPADATALGSKTPGTAAAAESTVSGTSYAVNRTSPAISSLDSIAARDLVCLKIKRIAASSSELSGDAQVAKVTISYSDT